VLGDVVVERGIQPLLPIELLIERLNMLIEPLSGVAVDQITPRLEHGRRSRPEELSLGAAQQLGVLVGPEKYEGLVHFV
jgi:hypothetical protein